MVSLPLITGRKLGNLDLGLFADPVPTPQLFYNVFSVKPNETDIVMIHQSLFISY